MTWVSALFLNAVQPFLSWPVTAVSVSSGPEQPGSSGQSVNPSPSSSLPLLQPQAAPQLAVRGCPQASVAESVPHVFPYRAHSAASGSGLQAPAVPHTLGVPPPPHVPAEQAPQSTVRVT